jgi:putative membrane protein
MDNTGPIFPTLNAVLNGLSFLCLGAGYYFIKTGQKERHRKAMLGAFAVSSAFLASYLWYHFHYESPRFGGQGLIRPLYFAMLITHIILATVMVPFIIRMLLLARKGSFKPHAKLGRWVWPVWMYVSFTGVLIYLMVYHLFDPGNL